MPARKRVAILQSAYIPWKGYFDIIGMVDTFVVYDDVQYSKNHWHNRNLIKTAAGPKWLTIPVSRSTGSFSPIEAITVQPFAEKHLRSIEQSYARAPFASEYREFCRELYARAAGLEHLSEINLIFLEALSRVLGQKTEFLMSSALGISGGQTERLVKICQALGAAAYLTGPAAADYLDVSRFESAGIGVEWMDYEGYPEYPQQHGPFEHKVSVIDLLLNVGPDAPRYMKWQTNR